jgi:hypothetical protein
MRTGRQRWMLRLAILLVAGLGVLLWAITRDWSRGLTIENRSGQRIVELTVRAGGENSVFRDVAPGATVNAPLGTREQGIDVRGRLANKDLVHGVFAVAAVREGEILVIQPGGGMVVRKAGR